MSNSQESSDSSESGKAKKVEREHDNSIPNVSKATIPKCMKSTRSTGVPGQNDKVYPWEDAQEPPETNTSHPETTDPVQQEATTEDPTIQSKHASSDSTPPWSPRPSQPAKRKRGRPPSNPDQPRDYACTYPTCPAKFARRYTLQQHLRIHTQSKPYGCDFPLCQERFRQLSHLKQHQRYHTGERPFKCDGCGKSFFQSTNLAGHRCSKTQTSGAGISGAGGGSPIHPLGEYEDGDRDTDEGGDGNEDAAGPSQHDGNQKPDSALETLQDDSHMKVDVDHKLDRDEDEAQP